MLLYFILGILFIEVAIPVVESFVSLILSWIEVAKGKASLIIAKLSADIQTIQKDSAQSDEVAHRVIGFALPDSTEDYEEEEDEE